jgi:hypothetical protein
MLRHDDNRILGDIEVGYNGVDKVLASRDVIFGSGIVILPGPKRLGIFLPSELRGTTSMFDLHDHQQSISKPT